MSVEVKPGDIFVANQESVGGRSLCPVIIVLEEAKEKSDWGGRRCHKVMAYENLRAKFEERFIFESVLLEAKPGSDLLKL